MHHPRCVSPCGGGSEPAQAAARRRIARRSAPLARGVPWGAREMARARARQAARARGRRAQGMPHLLRRGRGPCAPHDRGVIGRFAVRLVRHDAAVALQAPYVLRCRIGVQLAEIGVWSKVLGYVDPAKSGRRTVSGEDRDDGGGPPRETSTWHRTGRPEGVSPRAWRRGSPLHMPYDAAVPRLQCAWRPTGVGDSRSAAGRMVDRQ